MPSLRQKVTTYFRQLSFIAEPREDRRKDQDNRDDGDGNFIVKYLEGRLERQFVAGPEIFNGRNPTDMPVLKLGLYDVGSSSITAACTGPDEGLNGIKRSKLHLNTSFADDIDFIDTQLENDDCYEVRKSTPPASSISQNCTRLAHKFGRLPTGPRRQSSCEKPVGAPSTLGMRSRKNSKSNIANLAAISSATDPTKVSAEKNNRIVTPKTDILADGGSNCERERLLHEAVSNRIRTSPATVVAGVENWHMECDFAYGISVSLYENNIVTKEAMGNPIADCYGMVVRGDSAAMALADGVNWGDGARLAARSAVHGCLDYLDRALFGQGVGCRAATTQEVFVSLLRSLWEGHGCILEVGGALSTLTISVVLPLEGAPGKYVVCACNVGDSLGYIYSKKHGVRELTEASHDICTMRDMRDALGALGPADGNKPELSNLTFSMSCIESGDIIFLTSDGISDNFDPVVGKFAEAWTPDVKIQTSLYGKTSKLAPKRQNKSASEVYERLYPSTPLVARSVHQTKAASPSSNTPSRPKYLRSQTQIEPRLGIKSTPPAPVRILKSVSGLPLVTGPQRHALTLHRLEDLLSYGINGQFLPCVSARKLCHLLIDFVRMITSARRKTLEQRELFYKLSTGPDGTKREVQLNRMQHRVARKRIVDSNVFVGLPGKLDHATVIAYAVGYGKEPDANINKDVENISPVLKSKEFNETNF
ncbi:hypothetical protein KR018_003770 [Drosophila ironensis]|nr:hypothetical protein KR018_003770 [Drosophila ironensis]